MRVYFAIAGIFALSLLATHSDPSARALPQLRGERTTTDSLPQVGPLWFQGLGEDDPASVENDTPFPRSRLIINAEWTTPRYNSNPKVQTGDIIPVTWGADGHSYVLMDDGSVYNTGGTTLFARLLGVPPRNDDIPRINFQVLAHDPFLYGCHKSVTQDSCYSVGFTQVKHVFYAVTYDHGYPVVANHPPGQARVDYSLAPMSQNSWVHGSINFPKPVDSGVVSFVEVGQSVPDRDGCSGSHFPNGCIYAIVLKGGYQDPHDQGGMDQFNATEVYLARMAVGTATRHYEEVVNPRDWQWFAGFDAHNVPTWVAADDPNLAHDIRSLSYSHDGHPGCGVETSHCLFWNQPLGRAGYVNYPHMAYDSVLHRYLLTFAYWYYRDFQPPTESGPMVQGGSELEVLEAPHPWGPWSFVLRNPYFGSGNGYGPSLPVQWQGIRTASGQDLGQDLWMIWAANFAGCGKPRLVPADLCHGVYGINLRRVHLTIVGAAGAVPRPWISQDVGFASPGTASFQDGLFKVEGNGSLAVRPDPFGQYHDRLDHDAFHYIFRRLDGNGELTARLRTWGAGRKFQTGSKASTGLMLRESDFVIGRTSGTIWGQRLSPGDTFSEAARYGYLGVFEDGSVFFQWRDSGHVHRDPIQSRRCAAGCQLKLVRHNDRVEAFISFAHGSWRKVGSRTFSSPLSRSATIGMVATSDSRSTFPRYATYSGRFDNVRFHSRPPPLLYHRRRLAE